MGVLEKIPTFLITSVMVIVFVCLKRHARSRRLTLWTVGWTLVFTHFLAQLLEPNHGPARSVLLAVDNGSLQAAVVTFLVSVFSVAENYANRTYLLVGLGAPSVVYALCTAYDVHARWPYIVCLIASFGGGAYLFLKAHGNISRPFAATTLLCWLAGFWAVGAALGGSFQEGTIALAGTGFALAGLFICQKQPRRSPAVLTIAAGFVSWGAAFPIGLLIDRLTPSLRIPGELWNAPQLFVAFGMILAVVEDKSESIAGMQHKADRLDRRLARFSAITSRLLGGAELNAICPTIALAITDVSTFGIAVVQLEDEDGRLRVAGSSGLSPEVLRSLETQTAHWTLDNLRDACSHAQLIGKNSHVLPPHEAILFALRQNQNAQWRNGEEILIPLCADGGAYLGCIRLAAPRDTKTIHTLELSHIEMLATDIALAVELQSLHEQLVCSEKLAAMGQLLAGVAHELNNPLTAIMGYGELINDAIAAPQARDQLAKLVSEARRMNRIIDNLLRFSRQGSRNGQTVDLSPVVHQVLALREHNMRIKDVHIALDIAPDLPCLAVNEDEIKQILLNLFNNASDALEGTPGSKQISLRAYRSGLRAVIEVEDTGPGFANLNRALDPFYTTKPAGKGTGLGLSVCYGIVKKRGGSLNIENVVPHGARVTIKVPVAEKAPNPFLAAVARA
jgi:two-component system, NtrC family, sensor kinase